MRPWRTPRPAGPTITRRCASRRQSASACWRTTAPALPTTFTPARSRRIGEAIGTNGGIMVRRIGLRRSVVFTAIAVALAVVLFVVLERTQGAALPRVAVIEATRDVQIGEPLTASALQVVYVPQ